MHEIGKQNTNKSLPADPAEGLPSPDPLMAPS